ncbi:recombination regulator RecX [Photobacterium kagoshimensis]|uniref:recombination regulator RecX n=1 Tax=Photobacterium kagoshimensis TaxID=2910242 RepID=UPI003D0DF81F
MTENASNKCKGITKPKKSVQEAAIGYLSRRDHAEKELRQKLIARGYSDEEVDKAIHFCQDYNWLNDVRYASIMVRNGIAKGWGELRIQQEMALKGVDSSIMDQVLEAAEVDWYQHACDVAARKFGQTPIDTLKEKAKRYRFMQSRGFNFDQIAYAFGQDEEY